MQCWICADVLHVFLWQFLSRSCRMGGYSAWCARWASSMSDLSKCHAWEMKEVCLPKCVFERVPFCACVDKIFLRTSNNDTYEFIQCVLLAIALQSIAHVKALLFSITSDCHCRFNMDAQWSETGDRYLLKLFRDYLFHQVDEDGSPWFNLAHIAHCLNQVKFWEFVLLCVTLFICPFIEWPVFFTCA